MKKIIQFGENVEGYDIPVLNEREIRAAAGILFLLMFVAIQQAAQFLDFVLLKYATVLFLSDMLIRVFINPKFAPTLIIGRWIVRNQVPEYVGAKQKKFAWVIGIILALIMLILQVIVNAFSPITGLICFICLGCLSYKWIYKDKAQYCLGEICEIKDRQEIQKTSKVHFLIVFGFIVFMYLMVVLFHDFFSLQPYDLFGLTEAVSK